MWRASAPGPNESDLCGWPANPLAIHVNYLVNLASVDSAIRARSIACFWADLQRAASLGAEHLVLHPGSYGGQSLEEGTTALVLGLRDADRVPVRRIARYPRLRG